jgi:hypothetical protein
VSHVKKQHTELWKKGVNRNQFVAKVDQTQPEGTKVQNDPQEEMKEPVASSVIPESKVA